MFNYQNSEATLTTTSSFENRQFYKPSCILLTKVHLLNIGHGFHAKPSQPGSRPAFKNSLACATGMHGTEQQDSNTSTGMIRMKLARVPLWFKIQAKSSLLGSTILQEKHAFSFWTSRRRSPGTENNDESSIAAYKLEQGPPQGLKVRMQRLKVFLPHFSSWVRCLWTDTSEWRIVGKLEVSATTYVPRPPGDQQELRFKGTTPLHLSFWSFLTFLHHGIEEVERHLLWKFYKKIRRTSWSNVPPKLLACIGFLYKVVHKIGRLRKFNRSREI